MRVYYCDDRVVKLPEQHRFPMHKYRELRERLVSVGVVPRDMLHSAAPAPLAAIKAVHDAGYVDAFTSGTLPEAVQKRIGFPRSRALVQRTLASVGGTLQAARAALEDGISGNLAGGTHHAHRDFGSGYCVFNDIAVAARSILDEGRVQRVLVFDVDVHQGDGTAALFAREPRVFTCSIHGAKNFPSRKPPSDLDVPLPDGTGDDEYLAALERALARSLEAARPELCLVQGGVDALADDHLGRLSLTHAGMEQRDRMLLTTLRRAGIPCALTLGGGYARPIEASVVAHTNTYRVAMQVGSSANPG